MMDGNQNEMEQRMQGLENNMNLLATICQQQSNMIQ